MSKVGKKPISIPQGVEVRIADDQLEIKGKGGSLALPVLAHTNAELKNNELVISSSGSDMQARANWGTMRALAQNAITGVDKGFAKELEIQGVGYRASMEGATLILNMGFSHPVKFPSPEGIKISVEKNLIKISGHDKSLVGEVAAKIRAVRKPEPYLGKGIRYKGEVIKMKAGKKVAGSTGTA
jgi:large subunit ribosomal protein L6